MYALVETQWRPFFLSLLKLKMHISLGPANSLLTLFPIAKLVYAQEDLCKRKISGAYFVIAMFENNLYFY